MKKITSIFVFLLCILFVSSTKTFASFNTAQNIPTNYKFIGIPEELIVVPGTDEIWYVDSQNTRIVKINQSGDVLRTVGRLGTEWGDFRVAIGGITMDTDGYLYVLGVNEVYVLDSNGGMVNRWQGSVDNGTDFGSAHGIDYDETSNTLLISDENSHSVYSFNKDGVFNFKFGEFGSGNGQMNMPRGITVDQSNQNILVVDVENQRVQVFDSTGNYLFKFGTLGIGNGEFTYPKDVEVLTDGRIAVTSQNSQKIQIFTSLGVYDSSFGTEGAGAGQFQAPYYLATDGDIASTIYVSDWYNQSIQKFSVTGTEEFSYKNIGVTDGKLRNPTAVAYDSIGDIYILDSTRVQKFTSSGTYLDTIMYPEDLGVAAYNMIIKSDLIYTTHESGVKVWNLDGSLDFQFGTLGSGDGQFNHARGIGVDSAGNIYVSDYFNARIQKFDSEGNFLLNWGSFGTADGQFQGPLSLYVDGDNNVFTTSNDDIRIQIFNSSGVHQLTFGSFGYADNQFSSLIGGMVKDSSGNLYIADPRKYRITIWDNTYNYVGSFGTFGGNISQFFEPNGLAYNPTTDEIMVADEFNHRVQFVSEGYRIYNLTPSSDVVNTTGNQSLVTNYVNPLTPGIDDVNAKLLFGDYIVSDFNVDLTADRNWGLVNVLSVPDLSVALVENLDSTNAPGLLTESSLYVPKTEQDNAIYICPGVSNLSQISLSCTDGYKLDEVGTDFTAQTVGTTNYWKVLGITNVGAMSYKSVSHFDVIVSDLTLDPGGFISLTVTALDQDNLIDTNFLGNVTISLPGYPSLVYTFTDADNGVHTFENIFQILESGIYTINVSQTDNDLIFGTSGEITVSAPSVVVDNEAPTSAPILAGGLSNIPVKDDVVTEIIDDIVDGESPIDNPENKPVVNVPSITIDSSSKSLFDTKIFYWLIPILLVFFAYIFLRRKDNLEE